jgi:DNA-binding MarR family transcriptional regulator
MPRPRPRQAPAPDTLRLADRLHSAAVHLLRRVRVEDAAAGVTAPRLSALSVIVFRGPLTLSELAAAEQVRPPTITRLVQELERDGLVERLADPADRRVARVRATPRGRRLLDEGRARRVRHLAEDLETMTAGERRRLEQAVTRLERLLENRRESGRAGERESRNV